MTISKMMNLYKVNGKNAQKISFPDENKIVRHL